MSSSIRFTVLVAIVTSILSTIVKCQGLTDSLTWGGNNARSGSEDNHNMDPSIVASSSFGQLWMTQLPGTYGGSNEQIFAQPLIYTGSDGIQYVYIATSQNNVYKLNARTGAVVASRNLARPFLTADLNQCNDISPTIGSTATGLIDPGTGTWYLTTKTYQNQDPAGAVGRPNGRYKVFALSSQDLSDRANFPIDLEYTASRNNPDRWFTGGIHHQRPALMLYKNYIYAGFASHCIQYNYTGWIIGWDKGSGQIVERWTTMGQGFSNQISGAGVWMSGGGIASANNSMYFSTGNDAARELASGASAGMNNMPQVMGEAVVNAGIKDDGTIQVIDFFMPQEKQQLDNADRDLGTTPFQLLPPRFSCGNVKRIGMVTGKTGKTYWLNVDDLGGFRQGVGGSDRIIQSYQHVNSVYAGAGVYAGDGGYIYVNVIGNPTIVFSFSCQNGQPYFNQVAQTMESSSGYLGLGHGSTTSLNGQDGTGLLWILDPQSANLRVYNAVPQNNTLVNIKTYSATGASKFGKIGFGDGVAYHGTMTGTVYAYGSPVKQALQCSILSFPPTNLNTTSAPLTAQCQAQTSTIISAASFQNHTDFTILGQLNLPVTVQAGSNFSFPVSFTPSKVGYLASAIVMQTSQQDTSFTLQTRLQVSGQGRSPTGLLQLSPPTLEWNGVIIGANAQGVNQSFILSNVGNAPLNITAVSFSQSSSGPWNSQNDSTQSQTYSAYTVYNIPSSIDANTAITIPVNFNPMVSAAYQVFIQFQSTGGQVILSAAASGSDPPQALIEFGTTNGTWQSFSLSAPFSFGNVSAGSTLSMPMRITNIGGAQAAPLILTVSKPPLRGRDSYIGANNLLDLAEGTNIAAGQKATALITCAPLSRQDNSAALNQTTVWTMNLNDPNFGHQLITFLCTSVTNQQGPLDANGQGYYRYAGCFQDDTAARQLPTQIASLSNMTNSECINRCYRAGYTFAGTEYQRECWCGNYRPRYIANETDCNLACSGNSNLTCGGSVGGSPRMSLFGDIRKWDGNSTNTNIPPFVNPGSFGFSSLGCWSYAAGNSRPVSLRVTANNTVNTCLQACSKSSYQYAGLEYGGECYCGNVMDQQATQVDISRCSMACANNGTERCGAAALQIVYSIGSNSSSSSTTTTATTSTTLLSSTTPLSSVTSTLASALSNTSQSVGTTSSQFPTTTVLTSSPSSGPTSSTISSIPSSSSSTASATPSSSGLAPYAAIGCYSDSPADRTLIGGYYASGSAMSPQACKQYCAQSSYIYFGVEYGLECLCGNSLGPNAVLEPNTDCNMACTGNSTLKCGGNGRINVYQLQPVISTSSQTSASTTGATSIVSFSTSSFYTAQTSVTSTYTSGTSLTISSASSASTLPITSAQTTATAMTSITSASSSLSSFMTSTLTSTTPLITSAFSSLTNVRTSTSTSTITSTSSATSTGNGPSYTYLGCANDSPNSRGLNGATVASINMTPATCQTFCTSNNLPLAAVEYGQECWCGATLAQSSRIGADSSCGKPCAGDPSQICGDAGFMNIYNNTNWTPTGPKQKIANYVYQGCFVDQPARTVVGNSFKNSTMTEDMCVNACRASGNAYAGVEAGTECWCGNSLSQSVAATPGDCKYVCPGNPAQYCGGSYRLNLWLAT